MAAQPQRPDPQIVHYVPGEVCLVVEAAQVDDLSGWYGSARTALNDALKAFFANRPTWDQYGEAVREDLEPIKLEATFGTRAGEILQPLSRGDSKVEPSVALPGQAASTALLYYQIGTADDNGRAPLVDRIDWVRELTNLVNVQLKPSITNKGAIGSIVAATPNWLAAGGQAEMTGGGPGSLPERADPGNWDFHFPDANLDTLVDAAREQTRPSGVRVAVLDTCPDEQQVRDKAKKLGPGHALSHVLTTYGAFGPAIKLDGLVGGRFQHLDRYVVNWRQVPIDGTDYSEHYRMADHGLFVAGVIKNIAPWAEIEITRVLNDWGVGDLHALTAALGALARPAARDDQLRLIINLSLMVDQLPDVDLRALWWPKGSTSLPQDKKPKDDAVMAMAVAALDQGLARAVGALPPNTALIVAAAGNDANAEQSRPEPRLPARYDSKDIKPNVMGVAAMTTDCQSSAFSNEADVTETPQGIASFGGNAKRPQSGPSVIVDDADGNKDAVVGLFSADTLPISDEKNDSGWVYWAGTSFATPIISGIAADIWATPQGAADVLKKVKKYANTAAPPLRTMGIRAVQKQW